MHGRSRQQGGIDFERRVLRGRTNEGEQTGLDVRQEGVLLGLVEAMDRKPERCASKALSTASRMSLTPPNTAEILRNWASKACAISRAKVVLPTPGGPHKIMECGWPDSKATRKGCPSPNRWSCPITSSSDWGRRRSAKGAFKGTLAAPEMGSSGGSSGKDRLSCMV
jgi:hypothetical protein